MVYISNAPTIEESSMAIAVSRPRNEITFSSVRADEIRVIGLDMRTDDFFVERRLAEFSLAGLIMLGICAALYFSQGV